MDRQTHTHQTHTHTHTDMLKLLITILCSPIRDGVTTWKCVELTCSYSVAQTKQSHRPTECQTATAKTTLRCSGIFNDDFIRN